MYQKRALRLRRNVIDRIEKLILNSLEKGLKSAEIMPLIDAEKNYLEYQNLPVQQQNYIDGFCAGIEIILSREEKE